HSFSILLIRNANHLHIGNPGTGVQELLDLARINILAAADDHILGAAGDFAIAVLVHGGEITAVQPTVIINGAPRRVGIFVITLHDHVSAPAQLSGSTGRDHLACGHVYDLYLGMRQGFADG